MNKGVIYVAAGADYRDLAVQSAQSLRAVEPDLQIDLFCDDPGTVAAGLFDQVHKIANPHRRSKLDCMAQSRLSSSSPSSTVRSR